MSGTTKTLACLLAITGLLQAQEVSEARKARLSALLPAAPEFAAKPSEAARFFGADLYKLIDGGAEAYHQFGFVALVHREYKSSAAEITADIFDMGDSLRAFGIYSAERSPDYHYISMGAEGYAEEGTLNFLQGEYYVKLQGFGDKPAPELESAARSISAKIGGGRTLPDAVAWFPASGLVNRSQKYVIEAPLGHDFLSPAVTAAYRFGDTETTVSASIGTNAPDAARRLASLKAHYEKTGKVESFAGLPGEAWRASSQYEGEAVFFVRGRNLVVVANPPAQAEKFLKEVYFSIKD
jgi:hypothetical protein